MMKKLNDTSIGLFVLLTTCLSLSACDKDDENFPKDYVGFERPTETMKCHKSQEVSDLKITIIAMDKSKEDRTVLLSTPSLSPGQTKIVEITESKITIKAGKKSASTILKIYPSRMVLKVQNVSLSCIPQWKDGRSSTMTVQLKQE